MSDDDRLDWYYITEISNFRSLKTQFQLLISFELQKSVDNWESTLSTVDKLKIFACGYVIGSRQSVKSEINKRKNVFVLFIEGLLQL